MVTPIPPGALIAGFLIESHLNRSARTDTYAAKDPDGQAVLLRVLDSARVEPALAAADFKAEGDRIMKGIKGSLPRLLAADVIRWGSPGEDRLLFYTATEWLCGETLDASMAKDTPWISRALSETVYCSSSLHLAHENIGLAHGNLSPRNIIFMESDDDYPIRVLDIEAATLFGTDPEHVKATPTYRAPEQLRGEAIDHRADMYSLGLILYHAATGRHPFAAEDGTVPGPARIRMAAMTSFPRDMTEICGPNAAPIWAFIQQACAKNPKDRFSNWKDFAAQFAGAVAEYMDKPAEDAPLQAILRDMAQTLFDEVERRENRGPSSGTAQKPLGLPPSSGESPINAPCSGEALVQESSTGPATLKEPDTQPSAGSRPAPEESAGDLQKPPPLSVSPVAIRPPAKPVPVPEQLAAPALPSSFPSPSPPPPARSPSTSLPPSVGTYHAVTMRAFALSAAGMFLGVLFAFALSWLRTPHSVEAVSSVRQHVAFPVWVTVIRSPTSAPTPTPSPTSPPAKPPPRPEPLPARALSEPSTNQRLGRASAAPEPSADSPAEPKDGTRCGLPSYMTCQSNLD